MYSGEVLDDLYDVVHGSLALLSTDVDLRMKFLKKILSFNAKLSSPECQQRIRASSPDLSPKSFPLDHHR